MGSGAAVASPTLPDRSARPGRPWGLGEPFPTSRQPQWVPTPMPSMACPGVLELGWNIVLATVRGAQEPSPGAHRTRGHPPSLPCTAGTPASLRPPGNPQNRLVAVAWLPGQLLSCVTMTANGQAEPAMCHAPFI